MPEGFDPILKIHRGRITYGSEKTGHGSGALYVGRPTPWGNPFTNGPNDELTDAFRDYWYRYSNTGLREAFLKTARMHWHPKYGITLLCWCAPHLDCHADVLVEFLKRAAVDKRMGK